MDELTFGQLAGWIIGGIVALTGIIQVSPIKLNPWSWLAKKVGRAVNEEQTAKDNRAAILRFGDELRLGIKHSKESFDNVLNTISDYDTYCNDHPTFKNKKAEINERYIAEIYKECLRNNTFL